MGMAYNPKPASRANTFQVQYMVNTTGDRWFIPYNDGASKAAISPVGYGCLYIGALAFGVT